MTADQFDLTLEYYFGRSSSFTATGFYKKFYDYIQAGQFNLEVTNNGVTEDVRVNRPVNGDGASIDRKSVVSGKSGSVRVDLGGRRILKKKKQRNTTYITI